MASEDTVVGSQNRDLHQQQNRSQLSSIEAARENISIYMLMQIE